MDLLCSIIQNTNLNRIDNQTSILLLDEWYFELISSKYL